MMGLEMYGDFLMAFPRFSFVVVVVLFWENLKLLKQHATCFPDIIMVLFGLIVIFKYDDVAKQSDCFFIVRS